VNAVLPEPVALAQPDEDPAALADAVSALTGAGFQLGLLDVHLAGPAASAPGWLGDDAAEAAAQVGAVAAVVRDCHGALTTAADRLRRHAELLDETRRQVAALVARQDDDRAAAAARLGSLLGHPAAPWETGRTPVAAVGDEVRAADAARARVHAALLDELRADAVATARVLTGCMRAVGGVGHPGDAGRVVAQLAVELPGWGDGELSARGAALAQALLWPESPEEMERRAGAAQPYAGTAAFADALLTVLRAAGLRSVLGALPKADLGTGSTTAAVLAQALGAARRSGGAIDPVGEVLDAGYVDPRAPGTEDDLVAVGMAAVLVAAAHAAGSMPLDTVARWGGQVLRREQALRDAGAELSRAVDRVGPEYAPVPAADPVTMVLDLLAGGTDPAPAAALLHDRTVWTALLNRTWPVSFGGAAPLLDLVAAAAADPGSAGDAAMRAGLEVLGTGLADGDPDHWPIDPVVAAAVSLPLARGVAAHVDVAVDLLAGAGRGEPLSDMADAALRGLGYVSVDPGGTAVMQDALRRWASGRPVRVGALEDGVLDPVVAARGSVVAVRAYGQRLAYALHGFAERDAAVAGTTVYNWTIGLALNHLPGAYGEVAGLVSPFVAHWLHADGTWDNGRNDGLTFGADDAAAVAGVEVSPEQLSGSVTALSEQARAAFAGASDRLGLPLPPTSPEWSALEAVFDGLPIPDLRESLLGEAAKRLRQEPTVPNR
jgi:hypothetical protein